MPTDLFRCPLATVVHSIIRVNISIRLDQQNIKFNRFFVRFRERIGLCVVGVGLEDNPLDLVQVSWNTPHAMTED